MNLESIRIALGGVMANRLRSALTMLGILIGVGAVIVLVAVGNGSSKAVQKQIEALGTNTLIVNRGGFGGFGGGGNRVGTGGRGGQLTPKDVTALENKINAPDIKQVAPTVSASVTATYQGNTHSVQTFIGTTPNYPEIRNYETQVGSFFTQDDNNNHNKVVVLGVSVVKDLFPNVPNPLGATVQLNGKNFQVIGVFKPKGTNGFQDQDDIAMAPLASVQDSLTGSSQGYNQITVEAASRSRSDAAQTEITNILTGTHKITNGRLDFSVLNQQSLLNTSQSTNRVFTVLLGAVAAISLLVGGIGVMNIMLVTVTERTREIGIRKAIGARKSHILSQFLVESVLLTMIGGLLGVGGGLIGSHFKIVGVHPVVAPYSVFLAFGVAVLIGLFFGIYPANRAASLRPIDALRYE